MPRFCDSNIESDAIIGKGIDLEELFDQRIVIEKIKIEPTKFPGKNASGMRMQMQVVINAQFNDTADADGDFFAKGLPPVDFVVFDTTIAKVGKMFHFT